MINGIGLVGWNGEWNATMSEIAAASERFCNKPWSEVASRYAHMYCFSSVYILNLLSAYGLEGPATAMAATVTFTRKVRSGPLHVVHLPYLIPARATVLTHVLAARASTTHRRASVRVGARLRCQLGSRCAALLLFTSVDRERGRSARVFHPSRIAARWRLLDR